MAVRGSGGGFGPSEASNEVPAVTLRRDRLLAALTLTAGIGVVLGVPFALKAGAEFFLPTVAALVIAIALVPVLEWFERRGLPSPVAAMVCVLGFLVVANVALAAIVVPAVAFFRLLPERITRIQHNLAPLVELYGTLERNANRTLSKLASIPVTSTTHTTPVAPPSSIVELAATSAPGVILQLFFGVLVVFFFLSGWTRLRRQAIVNRASFGGAMATARVIQTMVDDVSAYLGTITLINITLGAIVAGAFYLLGMPFPLMWGGIVAMLNYVPYLGPILAAFLMALGGLMTFSDLWYALLPSLVMVGCHLVEANVVTPLIIGHRLTINPVLILISLSFWGWVWGTGGVLLAVPLLIIIQVVVGAAGKPDIAGFLFERGALLRQADEDAGPLPGASPKA
ncbi:AI-2E family transporter [uncultured Sphingomonas sp.]|uniref:AI-2E family transporter n=1 Tax=uncultured Sphingomonas sp. TaxID=158754 RepID=UPI0035C96D3C